jgi:hypothetical protein
MVTTKPTPANRAMGSHDASSAGPLSTTVVSGAACVPDCAGSDSAGSDSAGWMGSNELEGSLLADATKPFDAVLGQFGRIVQLLMVA